MRYILAVLFLAGCQTTYADIMGYTYPEECRRDLSHVDAKIVKVSPEKLPKRKEGWRVYGKYNHRTGVITIADDLDPWTEKQVIHHERCHAIAGRWH